MCSRNDSQYASFRHQAAQPQLIRFDRTLFGPKEGSTNLALATMEIIYGGVFHYAERSVDFLYG